MLTSSRDQHVIRADLGVSGVTAFTTLRSGGVSRPPYETWNLGAHVGDVTAHVDANRIALSEYIPSNPRWLNQVHGAQVVSADIVLEPTDADAAWTATPGVVCAVMTADCLPVVFAAQDASVVAIAHAGWRGLAAGVLENTVSALPVPASQLSVWLGPAISQRAFEVGDDVRAAFSTQVGSQQHFDRTDRPGHWHANLYALARDRLRSLGVHNISGADRCTFSEPEYFFSYRRDGQTGRMATVVFIHPDA